MNALLKILEALKNRTIAGLDRWDNIAAKTLLLEATEKEYSIIKEALTDKDIQEIFHLQNQNKKLQLQLDKIEEVIHGGYQREEIAANIMHDLPSGAYITKTIEELESFIYDLQNIRKKIK